ncbi:MAG: poly-gamma-glutamate synthase PgsB [Intestinibacter sp.]|uniref:poly-gamma-glutamate synthase PgsB n=2 Tax=Intestinibacter sp. TaxID=1965304 RepID=UPI002A8195FE|nr:poly-gamma-glutamate synthase PgsB [Intestinibacter sp.]MDY4574218.1 poly-gamma-glutamate synthase PgsB [Intestinibacter sp.]
MYDKTTIIQLIIIAVGIAMLFYLGVREKRKNEDNIKNLAVRINVNGIRGKSTVTRLVTGVLSEAGYKVVGKTTGTSPRMIYWNKDKEEVIRRKAGANIKEQIQVIDKARKVGADALVCECMAVRPEYQDVYQNDIFKANITVIVNVLEDHLDVMGPTTDEIAMAFSNTIPHDGYLVVDNGPYVDYFTEECKKRNTKIVVADNSKIPEGLVEKFRYTIFEDNISLALAVAEILEIDPEVAFEGMLAANPDPGAATIVDFGRRGESSIFVNGFAANEPSSTLAIWDKIKGNLQNTDNPIILFNGREDRVDRTDQFIADCFPYFTGDVTLVAMGEGSDHIDKAIQAGKLNNIKEYIDLSDLDIEELIEKLYSMSKDRVIYGIGNIHGDADILLQEMFGIYINDEENSNSEGFSFGSKGSLSAHFQNLF